MNWEELTGDQFPQTVETAQGVCLLPLSCVERHGHHLPVGTDMFIDRELCRRAAAIEPAIIFPDIIFTQIFEACHCQGTIAIDPELILSLLDNICREIARNGMKKIVIFNAHGGNEHLIQFFAQIQLAQQRDYVVYVVEPPLRPEDEKIITAQWQTTVDGHAGECETSQILVIRPELVQMNHLPSDQRECLKNIYVNYSRWAPVLVSGGMQTILHTIEATADQQLRKKANAILLPELEP